MTKGYLIEKFNELISNYINKFDLYLNNYINYTQTLYDNLYNFTEEKIHNSDNIFSILNEYKNVFTNMLMNNTEEKIFEKIYSNNEINISSISKILINLEDNLLEINNNFYKKLLFEK